MKVLVIHHDDQDGRMGGYIMCRYYKEQGYETVVPFEADYNTQFDFPRMVESGDKVCIVDFSLNNEAMHNLQQIVDFSDITWIDHHKSAIETYTDQKGLDGIRYIGLSGCELAYIYAQGYRIKHDDKCVNINTIGGDMEFTVITSIEIPRAVKLIGDWDVWRGTPDSREFAFALRSDWPSSVLETPEGYTYWENIYAGTEYVDKLIEQGRSILKYVYGKGETDLKEYGYPVKIRKFESIEAIAINSCDRSSLVFESVKDDYEVGLVFNYTMKNKAEPIMTFSIYRLGKNPDKTIDVSFIAKAYGGGGHPDASGFSTSGSLPFTAL